MPGPGESLRSDVFPQGPPLTLILAPAPPQPWAPSLLSSANRTSSLTASLRSVGRSSSSRTGECRSWLPCPLPCLHYSHAPISCSRTPLGASQNGWYETQFCCMSNRFCCYHNRQFLGCLLACGSPWCLGFGLQHAGMVCMSLLLLGLAATRDRWQEHKRPDQTTQIYLKPPL